MSTDAGLRDDAFTPAAPPEHITITEPARETPVHAVTQVLVVGGGPAGFAAALAARANDPVSDVDTDKLWAELRGQGVYLQAEAEAGAGSTGTIAGGPPRGPKVSITADTPLL